MDNNFAIAEDKIQELDCLVDPNSFVVDPIEAIKIENKEFIGGVEDVAAKSTKTAKVFSENLLKSGNSQASIILKMLGENEDYEWDPDSSHLSPSAVLSLYSYLQHYQCVELFKNDHNLFFIVAQQIGNFVMQTTLTDLDVEQLYLSRSDAEDASQSTPRALETQATNWLKKGRDGSRAMETVQAVICASELIIRFLTADIDVCQSSTNVPLPISMEHVEKAMQLIGQVIVCNFGTNDLMKSAPNGVASVSTGNTSPTKKSSGNNSPTKKTSKRAKTRRDTDYDSDDNFDEDFIEDNFRDDEEDNNSVSANRKMNTFQGKSRKLKLKSDIRRLILELNRQIGSTLASFVVTLECWYHKGKQRDRIIFSTTQLIMHVLGLDPMANPRAECLDVDCRVGNPISGTGTNRAGCTSSSNNNGYGYGYGYGYGCGVGVIASPLLTLQKNSISLIRHIFQHYEDQRQAILNDMLPMFAQIYSNKSPCKAYSLTVLSNVGVGSRMNGPLSHDTAIREGQFVSVGFAALLAMLQAIPSMYIDNNIVSTVTASPIVSTVTEKPSTKNSDQEGKGDKKKRKLDLIAKANAELAATTGHNASSTTQPIATTDTLQSAEKCSSISKLAIAECRKSCTLFVSEFLKRCENKDMSGEYRIAIVLLIEECLVAVTNPNFPVASILLQQMVSKLLMDLHSPKQLNSNSSTKADYSSNFLCIELIGNIGHALLPLITDVERQHSSLTSDSSELSVPASVLSAIKTKSVAICNFWNQYIVNNDEDMEGAVIDEETTSNTKKRKANKGKLKQIKSTSISKTSTADHSHSHIKRNVDLSIAFGVCSDVMATILEASTSGDLAMLESDAIPEGSTTYLKSSGKLLYLQPDAIVKSLGLNELLNCPLPSIDPVDELSFQHWEYLLHLLGVSAYLSNNAATAQSGGEVRDAFGGVTSVIRDGCVLGLGLWVTDASTRVPQATNLNKFLESLFPDVHRNKKSSEFPDTITAASADATSRAAEDLKCCTLTALDNENDAKRVYFSNGYAHSRYQQLIALRILKILVENIISTIIVMFSSPTPTIRAKAMKILGKLVNADATLLGRDSVREAVTERFNDVSISVREEAVKLVGSFVMRGYDASESYINGILIRLRDKGVSVRKTVVAIIRDILLNRPGHKRYADMCLQLLERASYPKEEDTIRDTIQSTFQSLWFLPPSSLESGKKSPRHGLDDTGLKRTNSGASIVAIEEVSAVAPGSPSHQTIVNPLRITPRENHIISTTTQIIEVVSKLSDLNWIVNLIREMLHGRSLTGEEGQKGIAIRKETSEKHCSQIVDCLIEMLLKTEEREDRLMEEIKDIRQPADHAVLLIHTLALFSEAHPPLVIPHVMTLLPYLKGHCGMSAQQDASVCLEVCRILESAANIERGTAGISVTEVCEDLTAISLKYGPTNVSAAISAMSVLIGNVSRDPSPITKLAQKCFLSIAAIAKQQQIDKKPLPSPQLGRLQRCLLVYGTICEYYPAYKHLTQQQKQLQRDEESREDSDEDIAGMNITHIANVSLHALCGPCFSAAMYCLKLNDATMQARAVQAICSCFIGCPRLILRAQDNGLLDSFLSSTFPSSVHERLLHSLALLMKSEEVRLETGAALNQMNASGVSVSTNASKRVLGPVDVESDASIVGFMLQQRLPNLLQFLSSSSASLRLAALMLLGTLLRQGMLCPLDLISRLIGLQGDPEALIRMESLRILQSQDERHPFFLDNRFVDGIESAYYHQCIVIGTPQPLDGVQGELDSEISGKVPTDSNINSAGVSSVFKVLYATCVQSHKKRKIEFFNAVIRRAQQLIEIVKQFESQCVDNSSQQSKTGAESSSSEVPGLLNNVEACSMATVSTSKAIVTYNTKQLNERLEILVFLLTTLAYLPYEYNDEPLRIIYCISKFAPVNAVMLLNRMRQTVMLLGGTERGTADQMLPPAIGQKPKAHVSNSATHNVKSSGESHGSFAWDEGLLFDQNKFNSTWKKYWDHALNSASCDQATSSATQFCSLICQSVQACSYDSLLRLKYFLKSAYNLSDDKCQGFNPEDRNGNTNNIQAMNLLKALENEQDDEMPAAVGPSKSISESFVSSSNVLEKAKLIDPQQLPLFSNLLCNVNSIWGGNSNPSAVVNSNSLSLSGASLLEDVQNRRFDATQIQQCTIQAIKNHNTLLVLVDGDPNDFTIAQKKKSKGSLKKPVDNASDAPSSLSTGRTSKKAKQISSKKSSAKKRRAGKYSDEDDDEQMDFDDYLGEEDEFFAYEPHR